MGVVVGLDVRFVDHVETDFIGEVVQRRVVRVVRGADRVETEALQQDQVRAHVVVRHRAAGQRMEVVPVDAADEDALPVDQQVPADDLHVTETDAVAGGVGDGAVGTVQAHGQAVQLGRLGIPGAYAGYPGAQSRLAEEGGDPFVPRVQPVELGVPRQRQPVRPVQFPADVPALRQRPAGCPAPGSRPAGPRPGAPPHARRPGAAGRSRTAAPSG